MPIYGEGECLYGLMDKCRLGEKGIEVNPIYCLNCVIMRLADVIEEASDPFLHEEELTPTERELN